jgi:hypothetical protein
LKGVKSQMFEGRQYFRKKRNFQAKCELGEEFIRWEWEYNAIRKLNQETTLLLKKLYKLYFKL